MKYSDKLKDPRWQKKRLEVFRRDGWIGAIDYYSKKLNISTSVIAGMLEWNLTKEENLKILINQYLKMFPNKHI